MKLKMKTASLGITMVVATMAVAFPAMAAASGTNVTIKVNGMAVESANNYFSQEGRTFVDLAAYSKLTGISYSLNKADKKATINGSTIDVELKDEAPVAALRSVVDASGAAKIEWDEQSHTAQVVYDSKLTVYGDTVSQLGECVVQNRFQVGDTIVFRMTAANSITGQLAEDAKLQVHLSTGDVLDMHFGSHPPDQPNGEKFWTATYKVTDKTPKGTLNYFVTAETASSKGEYKPFNVMPSLLTIVAADQAAPAAAQTKQ
ncbi:hypothetical protein [Paenibacillus cremeus]|uniref:Copper amine oxidase-like N-terminal domain-containing protein n=1 Tax=Paenibacillus cremeus TaxID=2163881 RepID=A0A559KAP9_9BACL|nr:hypothetical protein [Paenibacillus cremeus]TVY09210.1 hypothetical protein FPZ49_14825 [Paenibacillus cremeus]